MLTNSPIETLRKLTVEEQDKLIREGSAIEAKSIKAVNEHKMSFPMMGKLVCVVEERLNELKSTVNLDGTPRKPLIAVNTSLAAYWGSLTKAKNGEPGKLNNHWLSCAVAFGTYVRTELITEADYDKCPAQYLEISASISTETGGDISHDAVVEAADVLKDRPKDAVKQLKDILATLKTPKALSSEKAKEMLAAIFAAGHLSTIVITMVGAEIAHLENEEQAREAFHAMQLAGQMFSANVDSDGTRRFSDEIIDGWIKGKAEMEKKPDIKNGSDSKPADAPADAKPKGKGKKATPEPQPAEPQMAAAA